MEMFEALKSLGLEVNVAIAALVAVAISGLRNTTTLGTKHPKFRRATVLWGIGLGLALGLASGYARHATGEPVDWILTGISGVLSGALGAGGHAWLKGLAGK